MIILFILCICLFFVSSSIGGGYYYWKQNQTEPDKEFSTYYCDKNLTHCIPFMIASLYKGTRSTTPSKWIKYHHSCTECVASYYFTFGVDAFGDCTLRLQTAKTADDIDSALNKLAASISESDCKNIPFQKRASVDACMFFPSDATTDVESAHLKQIYSTIKTGLVGNIKSAIASKQWAERYKDKMDAQKVGNVDPFLVMFYTAILETAGGNINLFSISNADSDKCNPLPVMKPCKP